MGAEWEPLSNVPLTPDSKATAQSKGLNFCEMTLELGRLLFCKVNRCC
jgi:hypothetical protein